MRTLQILRALLPLVLSGSRDRKRFLFFGRPVPRDLAFHQRRATRLVTTLGTLGPTFVKFGQLFAGRADLLSEPYVRAFSSLTDQVPPIPLTAVEQVIRESYGRGPEEIFERFDREPIAAASLGQVHRAASNGAEVVVKVLRPGVQSLVRRDIAAARRILGWILRWFNNPHVRGLLAAVDEFALRVVEEVIASYVGTVVLVAHRVVNKVLICALLGLDGSHFWNVKQDTCGVTTFIYEDKQFVLTEHNNTCFLKPVQKAKLGDF